MNKKLLAVAVACALAAPGVALAQASSVTISGAFKIGVENLKYDSAPGTRLNTSQNRVVDNASRIIFGMNEDLGGGLQAVAQLDIRFDPAQAGTIQVNNALGGGNSWVGLQSKSIGRLTIGRHDLHYGKSPDEFNLAKAGALEANSIALFDHINGSPIANASRTQNVVRYDMPNLGGFDMIVAWSANPLAGTELDMLNVTPGVAASVPVTQPGVPGSVNLGAAGAGQPILGTTNSRKGDGWNFNPQYTGGPFQVGYSYWSAKPDAPGTTSTDQRGDSLYGYYKFGGFKVGLAWNKSRLENSNTGIKTAERQAWSIPASYVFGPHTVMGHYTWAEENTALADSSNTGARMWALAYSYDLSKRTALGVTFAQIKNDANASYNFFTSATLGSVDAVTVAGEKPRLIQGTIKHAF